jgi:Na+-driven multidrug efflux pump
VVFFAVLIFSVTSILLNTIEGSGRTKQAMRIEILTIAIYLVAVYYVTIVNPQEIHVIWMTDYLYFGLLGAASWLYLRYSNWKFTSV